ncbi:MAG: CsoS2 family carboxysome shell protein [Gammaproteobacteria bacterium]
MVARAPGRAASLARREAMSSRGKAGLNANGMSAAQTARAANPHLSGRELAQALREQRSQNGKSGEKKSQPCGRVRTKPGVETGAAQDAPWKVGKTETTQGQTVTGTMVGRSHSVTGDEPSTCRSVTGTEYLGADIFRDFCQSDPKVSPRKVAVTSTSHGSSISGNRMGRGSNVTGNEAGTCKRVTGNEYISAEQSQGFCGEFMQKSPRKISVSETGKGKSLTGNNVGRSEKVTGDETGASRELTGTQYMQTGDGRSPAKVGTSATLRGGNVTGTMVGRGQRTTGDEAGSCRNVTGDDYVGQEQYSSFCKATPAPTDEKVGISATFKGKAVTGTMTGRSGRVTGDEPGTCKTVTGTPYAGSEQYNAFCEADEAAVAAARTRQQRSTPGAVMTGQQPGVDGKMTGAARGVCETVSGTPYVGADQYAAVCPATAADTASPDFPQAIGTAPWQQFSVSSPAGEARQTTSVGNVTGNQYEQGQITGPFGMATGKVTGTEQARFGDGQVSAPAIPATAEMIEGRVKSRITGEGMDAGAKITGDDWDRGDNVTGTEGTSAARRNPTMRQGQGTAMAAASAPQKRNVEITVPSSKVTGGSGNTEQGALVTYSGGARG